MGERRNYACCNVLGAKCAAYSRASQDGRQGDIGRRGIPQLPLDSSVREGAQHAEQGPDLQEGQKLPLDGRQPLQTSERGSNGGGAKAKGADSVGTGCPPSFGSLWCVARFGPSATQLLVAGHGGHCSDGGLVLHVVCVRITSVSLTYDTK